MYGRRRIGKTFLIKEFFNNKFTFSYVGTRGVAMRTQLDLFATALQRHSKSAIRPILRNWFDAFLGLEEMLEKSSAKKKIVFIDEMPWIDTRKSNFVQALETFWNGWAALRNDIVLIVCGSSTSWMVEKIFHNKGGLFNRITHHIYLRPFTLLEVEQYLDARHFEWDRYTIAQCYMVLGGVPFYLSLLDKSMSLSQNIDRLFFSGAHAALRLEHDELFSSLFLHPGNYVNVICALCSHREGLTRNEIIAHCQLSGAGLSKALLDLERSDFIFSYTAYGTKSNNAIYRIKDFYTLFFYQFVQGATSKDNSQWSHMLNTPRVNSWQGFSFELLCLQHLEQIKKALGLQVMLTHASAWRSKDASHRAQIDLVIERADHVINLCEIKFSTGLYAIDKAYAQWLRDRKSIFEAQTRTRKATVLTFISTYGLMANKHAHIISSQVVLGQLFTEPT